MDRKRIGAVVAVAGAVVLVLSVFADAFGYGAGDWGWKQTVGTIVGVAALVVGLGAMLRTRGDVGSSSVASQ